MLSIHLEGQAERRWLGVNPSPATFPKHHEIYPLLHQWRTYNATRPLIINIYNTGTGKTKAALLRLLKRVEERGRDNLSSEDNALLIVPTNELLAQHVADARKFCRENNLPYIVAEVNRKNLNDYIERPDLQGDKIRRGQFLSWLIENPRQIDPDDDGTRKPLLMVVNPDIFYYALTFAYNQNDRLPLYQDFLNYFNFIIVDEFHYYNPKQFANFLFFMSLSDYYGLFKSANRQFCLLTATPATQVADYLDKLGLEIDWIKPDNADLSQTEPTPALASVELEIYSSEEFDLREGLVALVRHKQGQLINWLTNDQHGAIISSALWKINQIHANLLPAVGSEKMGRLTGPETTSGRNAAKTKSLILATPTVDIGYNFERPGKDRQNIDFLLFDARFGDEFIQRLGRAGRVLGKTVQNHSSQVIALVSPEFYALLKPFDKQSLDRLRLQELANQLPDRHAFIATSKTGRWWRRIKPL